MKARGLLVAFLLAVGLCFVPALGYGEVKEEWSEIVATYMDVALVDAKVSFIIAYPNRFFMFNFNYDPVGEYGELLPGDIDTKGKIWVVVWGKRGGTFSDKSGAALLRQFKKELEDIYPFLGHIATDMDTDIVAEFFSQRNVPLGYFYQGEYHLWEK